MEQEELEGVNDSEGEDINERQAFTTDGAIGYGMGLYYMQDMQQKWTVHVVQCRIKNMKD